MSLNRSWNLKKVLTLNRFTKREAYELRVNFGSRLIRVEANFKNAKSNWNKAGWLKQIYKGNTHPEGHLITFGSQFVLLPQLKPYALQFTPVKWLPDGYLKIWEFRDELSDDELDQFYSFINQGTSMPTSNPSDIRSFKKMLADQQALLTQQAAELATTGAKLVTLETTMVIENVFTVAKSAFTFADEVWTYNLVHGMNTLAPGVEVFDGGGDAQTVQTIVVDSNTLKIEFSQFEYDGNNFPIAVSIQAKNSPVVPTEGQWSALFNGVNFRLLNGEVEFSVDGGATVSGPVFPGHVVSESFISNGSIYASVENAVTLQNVIGSETVTAIDEAPYLLAKQAADTTMLG